MNLEYKSFLQNELKTALIVSVILMIIGIIALILPFLFKLERKYKIIASILLIIVVVCSLLYIIPYKKDIDEDMLIEFSGEVIVEDVYQGRGTPIRAVFIISGEKIILNLYDKSTPISLGKHQVHIVYSKYTKYLFEYEVEI